MAYIQSSKKINLLSSKIMIRTKIKLAAIFILFTLFFSVALSADFTIFTPDSEGFISDWLIAGPFPNEGDWPLCKGYNEDF